MDDLVTWLRAQLDEDERVARDALHRQTTSRRMIRGEMVEVKIGTPREWLLSAWPPERVLREVEAKRLLLREVISVVRNMDTDRIGDEPEAPVLLRLLALPYADRPGYRDEWRP